MSCLTTSTFSCDISRAVSRDQGNGKAPSKRSAEREPVELDVVEAARLSCLTAQARLDGGLKEDLAVASKTTVPPARTSRVTWFPPGSLGPGQPRSDAAPCIGK